MEVSQLKADLEAGVEESLSNMDLADRELMIRKLQAVLDRQYMLMMQTSLDNCTCPRCGQEKYSRYGFDKNRRQRYKCMSCGMIYTAASHANLLSLSKLDIDVWKKYCECFVDGLSLRKSADKCEVGLKTSLYMRRRILELIHSHLPSFEINPGSGVELDETFFRESFKGNHKNSTMILPRPAYRHGGKHGKRGIGKEHICVLCGASDSGDVFFDVACRGQLNKNAARQVLGERICSGTIVSTDRQKSYRSALREINVACHNMFDDYEHKLPHVDNYHSILKDFMHKFRGVSTKWLYQYLTWHKWTISFREEQLPILLKQITSDRYKIRRRAIPNIKTVFAVETA